MAVAAMLVRPLAVHGGSWFQAFARGASSVAPRVQAAEPKALEGGRDSAPQASLSPMPGEVTLSPRPGEDRLQSSPRPRTVPGAGTATLGPGAWVSVRGRGIVPSVIVEMSSLAHSHGALNLAEGFPDYPAPARLKEAAAAAILTADVNQYRYVISFFDPYVHAISYVKRYRYDSQVAQAVAAHCAGQGVLDVGQDLEVVLTVGQSGALAATLLAVVDPGEEVLLLDPSFEAYRGAVMLAGGVPRHVSLEEPEWALNVEALERAVSPRTKAIIVNSPCNPTGKVFSRDELSAIAALCQRHGLLAITDEVYEHFVYSESHPHVCLASLPGMRHRTVVTSSISKTFGVTGWRLGWAIAPKPLAEAIGSLSAKMIDSPPAPFQEAAKAAFALDASYYSNLQQEYRVKRDFVVQMLREAGLIVDFVPQGGVFVYARIPSGSLVDDVTFCKDLIVNNKLACVPGSVFFGPLDGGQGRRPAFCDSYVRVAFCKDMRTLMAAKAQMCDCNAA